MNYKKRKVLIGGKFLKVNGKFIWSCGYFAYNGCHKIYVLEDKADVELALEYGYRLYPIEEIQHTYETSCPLKFIENIKLNKYYVPQAEVAHWTEVKATKKEVEYYIKNY